MIQTKTSLPREGELKSFISADGTELSYRRRYVEHSKAVCLCLAGVESHSGWYEGSSAQLFEKGFSIYFLDRRGSGLSGGRRGDIGRLEDLFQDIKILLGQIRGQHGDCPIFLLCISWGAKVGLGFCLKYPHLVDGLILVTPGLASRVHYSLRQKLALFFSGIFAPGTGFKVPIPNAHYFTREPDFARFIENDELRIREVTARFCIQTFKLDLFNKRNYPGLTLPVGLFLSGQDQIINNDRVKEMVMGFGSGIKRIHVYGDVDHTLEFGAAKDRYVQDLCQFMEHLAAPPLPPVEYETLSLLQKLVRNFLVRPLVNYMIPKFLLVKALQHSKSEFIHESLRRPGGWRSMMIGYANKKPCDVIDALALEYGSFPMGMRNRKRLAVKKLVEPIDYYRDIGKDSINIIGVGAGTGINTIEAISHRKDLNIKAYLFDRDDEAFVVGEELKKQYRVEKQVQFIKMDLAHPGEHFSIRPDIVKLIGIVEHLPDDALHKLLDDLTPFLTMGSTIIANTMEDAQKVDPFLKRVFNISLHYRTPARLMEILTGHGFKDCQFEYEPLQMYSILIAHKR